MPQSSVIAFFLLAGLVIVVVIRGSLPAYASIVGLSGGGSLLSGALGAVTGAVGGSAGAAAGATVSNATAPGISALALPSFGGASLGGGLP